MKLFIQFILALLVSVPMWGQVATEAPSTTDTSVTKYPPVANALLWAITGKELTDTSYLYGTIHMIGKEDYFLTEQTKKAFNESDKIVFEINMENMNNMMSQFGLLMKAFMSDGQTLKDFLDEEEYTEVKAHFEEKGITSFLWNMMERIKPMFLSMFASTDLSGGGNPMASGDIVSYEMEFMEMAKEQEKPMGGLETAEYQISVFDSIPYDAQAQMLLQSIRVEVDTAAADELEVLAKLYKEQDINAMITMFESDEEGLGKYEEFLLLNRNRNWIPVMEGMMGQQGTFFGVGAAHLAGEEGVINLLRKEGYTLTPLKDKTILKRL